MDALSDWHLHSEPVAQHFAVPWQRGPRRVAAMGSSKEGLFDPEIPERRGGSGLFLGRETGAVVECIGMILSVQ